MMCYYLVYHIANIQYLSMFYYIYHSLYHFSFIVLLSVYVNTMHLFLSLFVNFLRMLSSNVHLTRLSNPVSFILPTYFLNCLFFMH